MADDKTEPTVRLFADWLTEQRNGLLHAELTDAMHELVTAVRDHGKGGELVIKIKVKPVSKSSYDALSVSDDVIVKKPVGERGDGLFFVDSHNNLRRDNPAQPRLPLREVGKDTATEDAADGAQEATK